MGNIPAHLRKRTDEGVTPVGRTQVRQQTEFKPPVDRTGEGIALLGRTIGKGAQGVSQAILASQAANAKVADIKDGKDRMLIDTDQVSAMDRLDATLLENINSPKYEEIRDKGLEDFKKTINNNENYSSTLKEQYNLQYDLFSAKYRAGSNANRRRQLVAESKRIFDTTYQGKIDSGDYQGSMTLIEGAFNLGTISKAERVEMETELPEKIVYSNAMNLIERDSSMVLKGLNEGLYDSTLSIANRERVRKQATLRQGQVEYGAIGELNAMSNDYERSIIEYNADDPKSKIPMNEDTYIDDYAENALRLHDEGKITDNGLKKELKYASNFRKGIKPKLITEWAITRKDIVSSVKKGNQISRQNALNKVQELDKNLSPDAKSIIKRDIEDTFTGKQDAVTVSNLDRPSKQIHSVWFNKPPLKKGETEQIPSKFDSMIQKAISYKVEFNQIGQDEVFDTSREANILFESGAKEAILGILSRDDLDTNAKNLAIKEVFGDINDKADAQSSMVATINNFDTEYFVGEAFKTRQKIEDLTFEEFKKLLAEKGEYVPKSDKLLEVPKAFRAAAGGLGPIIYPSSPKQNKNYDYRADGSRKGSGWLGEHKMTDGSNRVMTEYSIGIDFGEGEMEIPTVVPTLSKNELAYLLDGGDVTDAIIKKAVAHARKRVKANKSPFAN